jgi:hypothetical protein
MKAVFARSATLLLAATLAGCASSGGGWRGADVTRFHLGQPVARGQIAVEPFSTGDPTSPEFRTYAAAVERELARLGWNVVDTVGQSEQVALVEIERGSYQGAPRRSPVSVGVGGGTGSYGGGVGVGVGINLGGGKSGRVEAVMLQVRIKRRSDGTVFWEGRAETAARADRPEGQPVVIADRLAEALFRDFPGQSGQSIRVK